MLTNTKTDAKEEKSWWAVCEAARLLLPSTLSPAFVQGMTGATLRTAQDTLTGADLQTLLLPGLTALGITAEQVALPEETAALIRLLRERLRYGVPVPIFAFANHKEAPPPAPDAVRIDSIDSEVETLPDRDSADRAVLRQGLVRDVAMDGRIVWRAGSKQEQQAEPTAFRLLFTHAIRLRRTQATGGRGANRQAALWRGVAFAAAYPERALTAGTEDAPARARTAAFLREVAGRQRSPVATRLRRAAEQFDRAATPAEMETARTLLREAVLYAMRLPTLVQHALLLPPSTSLSDLERRELIYLARAGTRAIKILAAHRLAPEVGHADARRTLEQLRTDPDRWTRAIAEAALTHRTADPTDLARMGRSQR